MENRSPPRSQSLRKGRHSQPGQIYLVTTATHQRQPLFSDFELGRVVVNCMVYLDRNNYVEQMAYVVMPDHLHWLFVLGERSELSSVVRLLKGYSSRRMREIFMARGGAIPEGPLWQDGFHDHALRKEEDVVHVARYVAANPLRAGLVERLGDYALWDAVWV